MRLSQDSLSHLPADVRRPPYDRAALRHGIVHLGPGAFFRAHAAVYTDDAIAAAGGHWGIIAASLRSAETVDQLNGQDRLYTLLTRSGEGSSARIVGSILSALSAARDGTLIDALTDPSIRIVSLTVTEKAYGLDPRSGGLDPAHPDIAADLASPQAPRGAVGFLVEALARRRAAGVAPFTPLCCDNLPNNGRVLGRLVVDFAGRRDPALARWIEAEVPFPSTMVDRITPAATLATLDDAERLTGLRDPAVVETEPFTQWVIEDRFANGRPDWAAAGALFVGEVEAYEKMKLRMLNGAHSTIAYLGFLAGHDFVRDVMADALFVPLVTRQMQAAAETLGPVPGIDLDAYGRDLRERFANPAIAHKTYQIAMDGTQKLPQRLVEPAAETLSAGGPAKTYALGIAAWMRYAMGTNRAGTSYDLRDPRSGEIASLLSGVAGTGKDVSAALFGLPGLFPARLRDDAGFRRKVAAGLDLLIAGDVAGAIRRALN